MKARKGDLILVETRTVISSLIEARRELVRYEFGMVGSTTRDGEVTSWHMLHWGDGEIVGGPQVLPGASKWAKAGTCRKWVVSQKDIDVLGALVAAKAHHYDGHPNQPKPFDSLDEAKAAVRPYLTKPEKVSA